MSDISMNISTTIAESAQGIGKDAIDEFLWLVILGGFVCFAMVCVFDTITTKINFVTCRNVYNTTFENQYF